MATMVRKARLGVKFYMALFYVPEFHKMKTQFKSDLFVCFQHSWIPYSLCLSAYLSKKDLDKNKILTFYVMLVLK